MKISELRDKTEKELESELREARSAVRQGRFKVAYKQLKNVRDIRAKKRLSARILTVLGERKKT